MICTFHIINIILSYMEQRRLIKLHTLSNTILNKLYVKFLSSVFFLVLEKLQQKRFQGKDHCKPTYGCQVCWA